MGLNCLRNPCAVRLITMILLTVSDVDVALTTLFMLNLNEKRREDPETIIYMVAMVLVCIGFVVYFAGILWKAPQQKDKIMSLVKDLMKSGKSDFVTQKWRELPDGKIVDCKDAQFHTGNAVMVGLNNRVMPDKGSKTFLEMKETEEERTKFRDGLNRWGVGPVWDAVEVSNAKNCCELRHGMPLYRTAVFGFMAQPAPKDLGGIFNANALFSFTVGTFELIFGAGILEVDGFSIQTALPLSVSAIAFLLSLANVLFDFSSVLWQIEAEERMANAIKNRIDSSMAAEKQNLLQKKDEQTAKINKQYENASTGDLVQKGVDLEIVAKQYEHNLLTLNQQAISELDVELKQWKKKLQKERDLLRGKTLADESKNDGPDDLEEAIQNHAMQGRVVKQINDSSRQQLEALDPGSENYTEELDRITKDWTKKTAAVKEGMAPLLRGA